jgi:nitrate reductase gamma subunit
MRDYLLFAVAPYVAAGVFLPACVARYALWHRRPRPDGTSASRADGLRFVRAAWRSAFVVVALGHLLAFAFPEYLLSWDRQLSRLVVLEVTGLVAGSLASAGLLVTLVRLGLARRGDDMPSAVHVVIRTLGLIGMLSGVGIAVLFRWASSWSEVTLLPYLYSVATLEPRTALVTHLPLLVKLHVACAFALMAALPFTDGARAAVLLVGRLTRWTALSAVGVARGAASPVATRCAARLPALVSWVLRDNGEEN